MVCDEEEEEAEDAEAEDAGEEAGSTDLKTRTPHHVLGKHVFFSDFQINEISLYNGSKILPKIGFRSGP